MIFTVENLCTLIVIATAVLMVALERKFPYTQGQKLFRPGFFLDFVMYSIVQSYVMGLIIFGFIHFLDSKTRWSQYGLISHWPVFGQLAFFFVIHDLYIYLFHRLQHAIPFLWRFHQAHHSIKDVDWLAGSRSHPIEILINQTIEFAPIILLGAAPHVVLYKAVIDAVWGMYIHSNINVRSGWLQYFINGPEMHRWHHANDVSEIQNRNFSTKLAIWDWLFGTAYLPANKKPARFGISNTEYPETYLGQVFYAFKKDAVL